jgi:hypothetical protein
MTGSLIVLIEGITSGVEGLGIISGNCTGFEGICSTLFIDDENVIDRVTVGGFKRLTNRCDD